MLSALAGLALALLAAADGTSLVDAVKNADKAAVRALVQKKVDVNAAEPDGTTALHWASYRDDLETVDLLLRAGAKVNAATDLGVTPLWNASQNGSAEVVARLLAAGADPNAALFAGETPLMIAARGGSVAVVAQLIAKGANVNVHGARGQTALMWAAAQKHPEVVKVLVENGADVHARSQVWDEVMAVSPHGYLDYNRAIPHGGDTPLIFAARVGDLASAKLLVTGGANVNDADAWGVSAVTMAAHAGFGDLVAFLLEKSADPNQSTAGFTALHAAIMRRDERMVNALLEFGANPNAPVEGWTPTRRSSKDFNFSPELVGATPFWLAARFTQPRVMRLLVDYGADPLIVHRGDHVVESKGGTGTGFEHKTDTTTALMAATGMGGGTTWIPPERGRREALTLEAVKLAVELGVDVNAANTDGRTALDAAKTAKLESVVAYLVEHGAKSGK
jgi:ankyrin repeat protein